MANTTIKVSQLPNIGLNLNANTLMLAVSTNGSYSTDKINLGNLANYVLSEAGNLLQEAFVSELAYSVTNSAQPNITSVGTLNISTLHISGGMNGYVLQTDGEGNLNWTAMSGSGNGAPGGSNGQIQFNNNGFFDASANITYSSASRALNAFNLTVSNTAFFLGNLQVFNRITSNTINAVSITTTGNITANNIGNISPINLDGNSSNVLLGTGIFGTSPPYPNSLIWTSPPSSNVSEGVEGQVAFDTGGNLFICVSTNTWSKITGTTSW